jgi:hypothetical protein
MYSSLPWIRSFSDPNISCSFFDNWHFIRFFKSSSPPRLLRLNAHNEMNQWNWVQCWSDLRAFPVRLTFIAQLKVAAFEFEMSVNFPLENIVYCVKLYFFIEKSFVFSQIVN